jgi:hypothetical protein
MRVETFYTFQVTTLPTTPCEEGLRRLDELGYIPGYDIDLYDLVNKVENTLDCYYMVWLFERMPLFCKLLDIADISDYVFEHYLCFHEEVIGFDPLEMCFNELISRIGLDRFKKYYKEMMDYYKDKALQFLATCESEHESLVE